MLLTLLLLLPPLLLLVFIFRKDRVEKEPLPLLLKLFLLGGLTMLPAVFLETRLERIVLLFAAPDTALFLLLDNLLCVALVEELLKWVPVRLCAWNHPAFDYRFDAIVYCVFSALGFAAVENVLYVATGDLSLALLRAITAIPAHMADGVIMGYYLGYAKQAECAGDRGRRRRYLLLGLLLPILLHGAYDGALSFESVFGLLFWLVLVVIVYVRSFRLICRASAEDARLVPPESTDSIL